MGGISNLITNEVDQTFQAGGRSFRYINSDFARYKTTDDEIIILKPAAFLRMYDRFFEKAPVKNVLEFGVFEGGSLIIFALAYPDFKFVGIDIRPPNEAVLRHIHDLGLQDRLKIYYKTSQADADAVDRIVRENFGDEKLGIISDDASHLFSLSRETFQLTFGRLAPNGVYCLEDWNWAHSGEPYQTQLWTDEPALTNLVFEILLMFASTRGYIKRLETDVPALMCIWRDFAPLDRFEFDKLIRMRGKTLTLI
jgi:cephalosporin hydroxylase